MNGRRHNLLKMEDDLSETFRALPDNLLEPGLERDARKAKAAEARRGQQEREEKEPA